MKNLKSEMRAKRVFDVLRAEPTFRSHMRNYVKVANRSGRTGRYPVAILKVVDDLASRGIDGHKCNRNDILSSFVRVNAYQFTDRH